MPGMSETPKAARQVSDEPSPRRLLSTRKVYKGRIWDVVSDSFQLSATGESLTRDYIDHPGAVAVLPMNDAGEILLIKQYRHPVGMDLWEIPAGLLDVEGEDFVAGAARELAEEADLVAGTWNVLADFFNSRVLQRGDPHLPGPGTERRAPSRTPRPHGRGSRNRAPLDPARRRGRGRAGRPPAQPVRRRRNSCRGGSPRRRLPGPAAGGRAVARPSQPALMTGMPAAARSPGDRPPAPDRVDRGITDYLQHMGVERGAGREHPLRVPQGSGALCELPGRRRRPPAVGRHPAPRDGVPAGTV